MKTVKNTKYSSGATLIISKDIKNNQWNTKLVIA